MYFHSNDSSAAVAERRQLLHSYGLPAAGPQTIPHNGHRTPLIVVSRFDEGLISLLEVLKHTKWAVYWFGTCALAVNKLRATSAPVVLCDLNMLEGGWRDMLAAVSTLPEKPRLIVTARHADEIWAEALNLGAYDVLEKPFDADEVVRTIGLAYQSWVAAHDRR
jgi:DNA-binding NtrC family response regulator